MNIAIFTGGDSSEYGISMKSAEQVRAWLENAGHICFLVEVRGAMWTVHQGDLRIPLDKTVLALLPRVAFSPLILHGIPYTVLREKMENCKDGSI